MGWWAGREAGFYPLSLRLLDSDSVSSEAGSSGNCCVVMCDDMCDSIVLGVDSVAVV